MSFPTKYSSFERDLAKYGSASVSLGYVTSPVGALFVKVKIEDKLEMALIDCGSSVNLVSDTIYTQLREPSQIRMFDKNIIAANNGKMPVE